MLCTQGWDLHMNSECCLSLSSVPPFLSAQASFRFPVNQIVYWCSFWLHFLPLFQNYFPWDFPEKLCSSGGGSEGRKNKQGSHLMYSPETLKRLRWAGLHLWWPCRVHHNNCSLEFMGGVVNFSVKIFPVGVPGSNSLSPSFSPTSTDFLWSLENPYPQPKDSIILTCHLDPRTQGDIYIGSGGKRKRNSALAGFYSACHVYHHWSYLEKDFRKDWQEVNLFLLWGGSLDCERFPWLSSEGTFWTS